MRTNPRIASHALGPGIDCLGEGHYFVAPPSQHRSGKQYVWAHGYGPASKKPNDLPSGIQALLQPAAKPRVHRVSSADPAAVTPGHRNTTLTSTAGKLRRDGLSKGAIRAALMEENKAFNPPLPESEVDRIISSIWRYPVSTNARSSEDPATELMDRVLAEHFRGGATLMCIKGTFWGYNGRFWEPLSEEILAQTVLKTTRVVGLPKGYRSASMVREVISLLKAQTARADDPLRFHVTPLPVINCRNGELWFRQGSWDFKPHSANSYQRGCLNIDYNPKAVCPLYDQALKDIFAKSSEPAAMARFWNLLTGYIIQQTRRYPLIIVAWGEGSNAKSSLKDTWIRLLGTDLVYAGQAHKLSEGRFTFGHLFGKLLFVDDDVAAGVKLPDGELKTISEEKVLTGEQKYKEPFNFTSRTIPLLLCNNVPSLADLSHGMLRRLVIVPFDRRFVEDEIDLELFPKIWREEMSGILNRALEGYVKLVQDGKFIIPKPVRDAKTSWLRQANPLTAFLNEECNAVGPPTWTLVADVYRAFCDWAKAAGITRVQQRLTFKRNLQFIGFPMIRTNRGEAVLGLVLRVDANSPVKRSPPPVVSR